MPVIVDMTVENKQNLMYTYQQKTVGNSVYVSSLVWVVKAADYYSLLPNNI